MKIHSWIFGDDVKKWADQTHLPKGTSVVGFSVSFIPGEEEGCYAKGVIGWAKIEMEQPPGKNMQQRIFFVLPEGKTPKDYKIKTTTLEPLFSDQGFCLYERI